MQANRSVPVDTVLPHLMYPNVSEAAAWLTRVFGFSENYRYGGEEGDPSGAQLYLGSVFIMLHRKPDQLTPAQLGYGTQSLTVFVEDVEAHFSRSRAERATIVEELHETVYGELQYGVEDLAGHHWLFSRHARDLSPKDWGAVLAKR